MINKRDIPKATSIQKVENKKLGRGGDHSNSKTLLSSNVIIQNGIYGKKRTNREKERNHITINRIIL